MADEEKKEEKKADDKNRKKSPLRWILIAGAAVVLGVGGYLAWSFFGPGFSKDGALSSGGSPAKEVNKNEVSRIICPLDSFVVNLMDKTNIAKRYLKVTMALEVADEEAKAKIERHKTQIRDTIILLLTSQTVQDLNSVEGKLGLKQELMNRVNLILGAGMVEQDLLHGIRGSVGPAMPKILSQEEVDSLLKGIDEGKIGAPGETGEESRDFARYDFRKEHGPVHPQMPGLAVIQERFSGALTATLSTVSETPVHVAPAEMASLTFDEFFRSISLPASLNLFKMEPLRGVCLLVVEGALVFAFVDLFLGGTGQRQVKLEGRSFTPIEIRIVEKMVKLLLEGLEQAWSETHKLHMVFVRSEIDPQFAEIARPDEIMVVNRFAMEIGKLSGQIMIGTPFASLESLRGKLRGGFRGETLGVDETWKKSLEQKIGELKVGVSCTFGHSRITGRDLLEMKVNDVIPLEQRPEDPVVVCVEGVPKFTGHLGTFRQNKAIRVEGRLTRE